MAKKPVVGTKSKPKKELRHPSPPPSGSKRFRPDDIALNYVVSVAGSIPTRQQEELVQYLLGNKKEYCLRFVLISVSTPTQNLKKMIISSWRHVLCQPTWAEMEPTKSL